MGRYLIASYEIKVYADEDVPQRVAISKVAGARLAEDDLEAFVDELRGQNGVQAVEVTVGGERALSPIPSWATVPDKEPTHLG